MKNLLIVTMALVIPMSGFAKVSDFNSMISENMQAQGQLHSAVKENVDVARIAKKDRTTRSIVVEANETLNVPTSKGMLTFEKEKRHSKSAKKVEMDRLATELNEAEF